MPVCAATGQNLTLKGIIANLITYLQGIIDVSNLLGKLFAIAGIYVLGLLARNMKIKSLAMIGLEFAEKMGPKQLNGKVLKGPEKMALALERVAELIGVYKLFPARWRKTAEVYIEKALIKAANDPKLKKSLGESKNPSPSS